MPDPITTDEALTINGRTITALELAQARQQLAADSPFNAGWYDWANLTPKEQQDSTLDAAGWLRALVKILGPGLEVAQSASVPTAWLDELDGLSRAFMCDDVLSGGNCTGHPPKPGDFTGVSGMFAVGRCEMAHRVHGRIEGMLTNDELIAKLDVEQPEGGSR